MAVSFHVHLVENCSYISIYGKETPKDAFRNIIGLSNIGLKRLRKQRILFPPTFAHGLSQSTAFSILPNHEIRLEPQSHHGKTEKKIRQNLDYQAEVT